MFCTAAVYCSLLQSSPPQTLIHKFGVAAVRGVVRNKNITEFQLEPCISGQQVVDGILAQLTADERRKFKVGRAGYGWPSIELCPVGEWCIVGLLMQCLCCVCQSSVSCIREAAAHSPAGCAGLGGASSLLCVNRVSPVGGEVSFLCDCLELQCCHYYMSGHV